MDRHFFFLYRRHRRPRYFEPTKGHRVREGGQGGDDGGLV